MNTIKTMPKISNFILVCCLMMTLTGNSQDFQQGKRNFNDSQYHLAIQQFKELVPKGSNYTQKEQEIIYYLAESYRAVSDYETSLKWYTKLIRVGYKYVDLAVYAKLLISNSKYGEAREYLLRSNVKFNPEFQHLLITADNGLAITSEDTLYAVSNVKKLNSRYSDYGVSYLDGKVFISSSRINSNSTAIYDFNGQGYSNIYAANGGSPELVQGELNSEFNDGTLVYSTVLGYGFYTQCNGYEGNGKACNIYYSKYNVNSDTWSKGILLEAINSKYNSGHPAISTDGTTLIFSSDLPGGLGGNDLWKIARTGSVWGNPENLGPEVNTPGNELFPSLYNDSLLYFATDGRPGYGGLDIYEFNLAAQNSEPALLKLPVNSSADDFGLIMIKPDSGFFVSNRKGGLGDDDIYQFKTITPPQLLQTEEFVVKGEVTEAGTGVLLPGALVILEGRGYVDSVLTDSNGKFEFENRQDIIASGDGFSLKVSKGQYLNDFMELSSEKDLFISGLKFELIQFQKDEISIENIYYDYGKYSLRKESYASLNKLSGVLKANPMLAVQINAHTDSRGSNHYNLNLSQKRAESVVTFLLNQETPAERLQARGWGEELPLVSKAMDEYEHEINRRTTFKITNYEEVKDSYSDTKKPGLIVGNSIKDELNAAVYKIKIEAADKKINPQSLTKLQGNFPEYEINYKKEINGTYSFTIGEFIDINEAESFLEKVRNFGHEAFVIALINGKEVPFGKRKLSTAKL